MKREKSVDDDSRTIGFRVHPPLYEWIKAQAVDGESPHQVVRRLIQGLAVGDGVTPNSNTKSSTLVNIDVINNRINDRIDERVNQRFMEFALRMAAFDDSLERLRHDVVNLNQK